MIKDQFFGVFVDRHMKERISGACEKAGVSQSELIRRLLHLYIDKGELVFAQEPLQKLIDDIRELRGDDEKAAQLKKLEDGGAVLVDSDELDRIKQNVATLAGMHQLVMPYIRRALQRGQVEATERQGLKEYLARGENLSVN